MPGCGYLESGWSGQAGLPVDDGGHSLARRTPRRGGGGGLLVNYRIPAFHRPNPNNATCLVARRAKTVGRL